MGKRRDIYRGRHEAGFNIDRDIDLAHLRELTGIPELEPREYNYFGLYMRNIVNILLNSADFRGYPEDVKQDITSEALVDMIKARCKFKGGDHPQPTAPFNYFYRIAYHSAQHCLTLYYRMQSRMCPASQVGQQNRFDDGGPVDDILETEQTDWDLIAESLRYSQKEAVESEIEKGVPS